jgi:SAM-dependent methyltransferase
VDDRHPRAADILLAATARAEEGHFWFRGFRRFVAPLISRAARGREDLRLLDCGCGTGANLGMLGAYGRAWGFDVTFSGLQVAQARGFHRIARASIGAIPFPPGTFDIVTSFDVLVCLEEPLERAAVAEMARVLKPGGSLILNVAAMPILRGNHSVLSEEVRRYDKPRMRRILAEAGFRIERMRYTNATLFPALLLVRGAQRLAGLKPPEQATGEITMPPVPVNAVLSSMLAVEAALQRAVSFPVGSSLLCLARKPA